MKKLYIPGIKGKDPVFKRKSQQEEKNISLSFSPIELSTHIRPQIEKWIYKRLNDDELIADFITNLLEEEASKAGGFDRVLLSVLPFLQEDVEAARLFVFDLYAFIEKQLNNDVYEIDRRPSLSDHSSSVPPSPPQSSSSSTFSSD